MDESRNSRGGRTMVRNTLNKKQSTMEIKNDVNSRTYAIWEKALQEVEGEQHEAKRGKNEPIKKAFVNKSVVREL